MPTDQAPTLSPFSFLSGGGEMGSLTRAFNWETTALGAPEAWPQSLRVAVGLLLNSRFPMFIWWGEERITLYNDAYKEILGDKHPSALGAGGPQVWKEIWDVVGPLADRVMNEGASTWAEDQLLYINRQGFTEESYFTFSYSPLFEEGKIVGVFCACTETTEKVLAARAIKRSEENLKNFIIQAPVAMCILRGKDFIVEIANDRMYELWGRGQEDLLNKSIFVGIPEAQHQGYEELLNGVYTSGETYTAFGVPVILPRANSVETIFINLTYEALRESDGSISGVMAVAVDVTEQVINQRKIEEGVKEVQEAEEKARLAIASADLGTFDYDYLSQKLYPSSRFEEIVGWGNDSKLSNYVDLILPEDQAVRLKAHEEAMNTGNLNYEARIIFRKTETRWIRVGGKVLFDETRKPLRLIGIAQDITETKRFAEELERQVRERTVALELAKSTLQHSYLYLQNIINKFETALASIEPVFEGDTIIDFRFKMTNTAYAAYAAVPPERLQGKRASEFFPNYQKTDAFDKYVHTYKTGETQKWDLHYNVDGFDAYLEIVCSKMGNEVVINFVDYTNLKSLQFDLIKNIEELQRSNKNLEDFAYAASHDLKEPIRKINFYSDRLKSEMEGRLDERQLANLNKLQNATMRMYTLVDDLLSYSQVNVRPRDQEDIDLNELLKNLQYDLELDIIESGAKFNIGTLPVVRGYGRQLQQLFQNLLSNAIKYRKRGELLEIGISSEIRRGSETGQTLTAQEMNKDYYHIVVKDNGIGFEAQNAERIFDVFQRLHNAEYRGTGVGLSIARKVANNHNGFIWAEGEEGKGASFHLLLPVLQ